MRKRIVFGALSFTAAASLMAAAAVGHKNQTSQALRFATMAYMAGDVTRAQHFFDTLARQGVPEAQTALGKMALAGEGVPRHPGIAAVWFYKAAQAGDADAQLMLANQFSSGVGVSRDLEQAYLWARLAQQRGDPKVVEAAGDVIRLARVELPADTLFGLDADVRAWRGAP